MFKAFAKQHEDKLYVLFRIIVGLLFFQHGLQKIFGLLGGTAANPFTQMWFAGVIELVVGAAITAPVSMSWITLCFMGCVSPFA